MPIRPATWGTREPTGKYVYSFIFYAIKYYYTVNFESTKLMFHLSRDTTQTYPRGSRIQSSRMAVRPQTDHPDAREARCNSVLPYLKVYNFSVEKFLRSSMCSLSLARWSAFFITSPIMLVLMDEWCSLTASTISFTNSGRTPSSRRRISRILSAPTEAWFRFEFRP